MIIENRSYRGCKYPFAHNLQTANQFISVYLYKHALINFDYMRPIFHKLIKQNKQLQKQFAKVQSYQQDIYLNQINADTNNELIDLLLQGKKSEFKAYVQELCGNKRVPEIVEHYEKFVTQAYRTCFYRLVCQQRYKIFFALYKQWRGTDNPARILVAAMQKLNQLFNNRGNYTFASSLAYLHEELCVGNVDRFLMVYDKFIVTHSEYKKIKALSKAMENATQLSSEFKSRYAKSTLNKSYLQLIFHYEKLWGVKIKSVFENDQAFVNSSVFESIQKIQKDLQQLEMIKTKVEEANMIDNCLENKISKSANQVNPVITKNFKMEKNEQIQNNTSIDESEDDKRPNHFSLGTELSQADLNSIEQHRSAAMQFCATILYELDRPTFWNWTRGLGSRQQYYQLLYDLLVHLKYGRFIPFLMRLEQAKRQYQDGQLSSVGCARLFDSLDRHAINLMSFLWLAESKIMTTDVCHNKMSELYNAHTVNNTSLLYAEYNKLKFTIKLMQNNNKRLTEDQLQVVPEKSLLQLSPEIKTDSNFPAKNFRLSYQLNENIIPQPRHEQRYLGQTVFFLTRFAQKCIEFLFNALTDRKASFITHIAIHKTPVVEAYQVKLLSPTFKDSMAVLQQNSNKVAQEKNINHKKTGWCHSLRDVGLDVINSNLIPKPQPASDRLRTNESKEYQPSNSKSDDILNFN